MSYLNTDVPELKGYDTGTVLGNLELWEGRLERMLEATVGELSELAEAIIRDASGDHDTVFSILLSLRGQPQEDDTPPLRNQKLLPQNIQPLLGMTRHLGLYERLVLYHLINTNLPEFPILGARDNSMLPASARGRVAYMSGAFADKAYFRFSNHIPQCRAAVFHSFVDACEEVWGGLCEYCILPLESATEGKLVGFSRLIIKYRLQIVAVCDIPGAGGAREDTTRFALLRMAGEEREAELSPFTASDHPAVYLDLLHITTHPAYSEIIAAAEFCGLSLLRADTLPSSDIYALLSEDGWQTGASEPPHVPLISTVWYTDRAELTAFLYYLALEASEDPILGLYPSL